MNYREFLKNIKENKIGPLTILFGQEKYLIDYIIEQIKKTYIDKSLETLNYVYLYGDDIKFKDIQNANDTLPFMSDKKIVVVEDWSIMLKAKENEYEEEAFLDYIKNVNNDSYLFFVINNEKIDNRRRIFKVMKKFGTIVELNKLKINELEQWIRKSLGNIEIDKNDMDEFIQRVGYMDKDSNIGLNNIQTEIHKLTNYVMASNKEKKATREIIKNIVTKSFQSNIFELVELIGKSNQKEIIRIFDNMVNSGVAIQLIIHMIIRQLRLIGKVIIYLEQGYTQAMLKSKINIHFDFIINKLIAQSKNFNSHKILRSLEYCLETEYKIKTTNVDEKYEVEKLLVRMSY